MIELKSLILGIAPAAELRELHKKGVLAREMSLLTDLDINDSKSHLHKNNFFHSLQVLDHAISLEKNGPDLVLRTAALLHDVGKVATRKFVNGKATFRNHETVGAKQVRGFLRGRGYTTQEIKDIQELIANHMRSFGFDATLWTDSAVRRLAADISTEEQLERLFVIFKADVTTKHEHKRAAIWAKADALYERVEDVRAKDARKALRPAVNGNELMEILGLKPGKELGVIMKFLNTDEGIALSRDEAIAKAREILS